MTRRFYRRSHKILAKQLAKTSRATCPTPGKFRYATAEFAAIALRDMNVLGMNNPPKSYYPCPCGWFHLTRQT